MTTEEIIKICKERNELEFLFSVTKIIAESDSIGEQWNYCLIYTKEDFNNAEKHKLKTIFSTQEQKDRYDIWLEQGGVFIYEAYLKHIGVIQ